MPCTAKQCKGHVCIIGYGIKCRIMRLVLQSSTRQIILDFLIDFTMKYIQNYVSGTAKQYQAHNSGYTAYVCVTGYGINSGFLDIALVWLTINPELCVWYCKAVAGA